MYKFKFADIGEGLHEGVVAEIYKKEGDAVKEGDSLFSVETDKVTSDIPAPVDGTIVEVLMAVGDTIHVGDDIYHIDDGSGSASVEAAPAAPEVKEEAPVEEKSSGGAASVVGDIEVSDKVQDADMFKKAMADRKEALVQPTGKVLATPLARKLAASKGVDLGTVKGSGPNGRILHKDIEAAVPGQGGPAPITPVKITKNENQSVPQTGMRRAISKAMKRSWNSVAYTALTLEVNFTKLWDYRQSIVKDVIARDGVKVTLLPFITRAAAVALSEFPALNGTWDDDKEVVKRSGDINIGIAVDTPTGLIVPVIKNAELNSVVDNARAITDIAVRSRSNKITGKDMTGGTFTITNYGSAGALYGVPVINVPEIAILGTGNMIDKVYLNEKGLFNGKVMHLTLAADHRHVDGAEIGRFLTRIKELLETPELLGLY